MSSTPMASSIASSVVKTPGNEDVPGWVEIIVFTSILVTVLTIQLVLSGGYRLFSQHFWLDELLSYYVVTDPDIPHSLEAISSGIEGNPPCLHLFLRAFCFLVGGPNETSFRMFAFLSVLIGLVGLYLLLRRAFPPLASFVAVLAIWSHRLLQAHAFDARFYGPWWAILIWFAYLLGRERDSTPNRWRTVLLGVSSILLCTIHHLGIITLVAVLAFELLFRRRDQVLSNSSLWVVALGPLALAASMPFFYFPQKAAYSSTNWWVPPATPEIFYKFLVTILNPPFVGLLILIPWLSWVVGRNDPANQPTREATRDVTSLAGLTGVGLVPFVLLGISYTLQSALIERYGSIAALALIPAAAGISSRLPRLWTLALAASFFVLGSGHLYQMRLAGQTADRRTAEQIAAIRQQTDTQPVYFESLHQSAVVSRYAPDLAERCFLLDFEPDQLHEHGIDPFLMCLRDLARHCTKYYSHVRMKPWDEVRKQSSFYLVAERVPATLNSPRAGSCEVPGKYPGFSPRLIESDLYLMTADSQKMK